MLGKKALLLFIVLVVLCISVAGCVSKSKYDTLVQDYETSQTNLTSAQREYDLLQSEMTTLQKEWETAKAAL
jgi:outer membrane murein-binding lipoprotein Lpp